MNMKKLGEGLVDSDRVLAIRPKADAPIKAVEVIFDNNESVIVFESDPPAAIQAYLAATAGAAAPRST